MSAAYELVKKARQTLDLTDPLAQDHLHGLVDQILLDPSDLDKEFTTIVRDHDMPLELRVAMHLAASKRYIEASKATKKIAVIYAMWGEHNRIKPKSADNPNGEDSLRTKINQLTWLFSNSQIEWTLYLVDDGCPHGSGKIAGEIVAGHADKNKIKVLFLDEAVPTSTGPLKNLASTDDSRKGGAIIYGAMKALEDGSEAIIYTDADNSVHLGQIGLLLEHFIKHDFKVVLGNRKDPSAVLVKQENRWGVGIKLLRHTQRMVGEAIFSLGILDSQAAFKLYEAKLLKKIIARPSVYDFSFDSDWIAASIVEGEHFAKVPFAFIDSFAESASIVQGPMTTWETLLLGLVQVVEDRNLPHNKEMASVLKDEIKSATDLELLIDVLPPELRDVADKDLGNPEIMSPEQVRKWIRKQKELNI
jgi:hypothetical protein